MKGQPLVALTTTHVSEGGRYHKPQITLYGAYLAALEPLGLAPVLITPMHTARSIQALLSHCSGLVLSGGEDVAPERYGEEPISDLGSVSKSRDEMEFTALGIAAEAEIPILGICRGCQVMNVFLGGTLYQDLPAQFDGKSAILHQQEEPWEARSHEVHVVEGSRLRSIVGTDCLNINSFHHQAVKDVAPTLAATAIAEDGLIEAVESKDLPWAVGVQWHPERHEATAPETDPDRRLFAAFRKAVMERREQP
ncbi:MAG: gamma-glutamyl-gamma-aminobutyrate hydrolase family protein [Longimicrobiales bacterium]